MRALPYLALPLVALVVTAFLIPAVKLLAVRFGLLDHPDSERKFHGHPKPRIGGVAIAGGYVAALVIQSIFSQFPLNGVLAAAVGLVFLIGLVDDVIGLKAWQKLGGQVVAATAAFVGGVQIHVIKGHEIEGMWWSLPVTVIWLVACSNAFNLIDGMDGLATGVGLFATGTVAVAAILSHNSELALLSFPLVGCLLGFLYYNFAPASIFLGDSGSLTIGFLLGCLGAMWGQKSATLVGMTAPVMAFSLPLLEVGLSITRRYLRGQPIFSPDRRHMHHVLLDQGLTVKRAALAIYAVCGAAGLYSLLLDIYGDKFDAAAIVVFAIGAWICINKLRYLEFRAVARLLFTGGLQNLIDTEIRIHNVDLKLRSAESVRQYWMVLVEHARAFGFCGIRTSIEDLVWHDDDVRDHAWQFRMHHPEGHVLIFYRPDFSGNLEPAVSPFMNMVRDNFGVAVRLHEGPVNEYMRDIEVSAATPVMSGAAAD